MPRNLLSPSIFWTFSTPASALYEPCRQSSKPWNWIEYPLTPPAAFFGLIANWMPLCTACPPTVHTGRSDPILMVPLDPAGPLELPHAKATSVAMVRTTSPLARTIWFPLVQMEALILLWTPPSFAALFPATPGRECAGGECGHTGWPNRHSVATIDSEGPP